MAAAPFAAQAETINIYGWQNHSWEFVDQQDNVGTDRSYDRMSSNAGNIGFAASMDAGNGFSVNLQCEQFTFYNNFASLPGGWCNRNSKIGLSNPQVGEIMLATWLLPYNEGVAQWVDPFYDAGADSHTSIMGSVGAGTGAFANPQFGRHTSFNRRQENIIQYWSPNWNGFVFRFAWTVGNNDETNNKSGASKGTEIDPVIRSSSLAYTNGPLWLAVTWQDHEDWTAHNVGQMDTSDAESFRLAGRYIMDMGDGMSIQLSAMWEDMEYEFNGVTSVDGAMKAFFGANSNFASSGNLMVTSKEIRSKKSIGLLHELFGKSETETSDDNISDTFVGLTAETESLKSTATKDDPLTAADETNAGNTGINILSADATGTGATEADASRDALIVALNRLEALSKATAGVATSHKAADGTADTPIAATDVTAAAVADAKKQYKMLVDSATAAARADKGGNVKIERDAWMVSGKIKMGGPLDFRFSYMDADDLEVSCTGCSGDWKDTAADAWNVGAFYTMPGGTELRLTYSEVNNDDNGSYGQGISGTGLGMPGNETEMFAVGIVHWFD